jgi:hypothetical protein
MEAIFILIGLLAVAGIAGIYLYYSDDFTAEIKQGE